MIVNPIDSVAPVATEWRADGKLVAVAATDALCTEARGIRHAAPERPRDVAPAERPPRLASRSYAGWMLLNDGISALTIPLGVGVGGYLLGGPIVHWTQGNVATGFGSLALRVGLPIAGAYLFAAPCAASSCGSDVFGYAFFGLIAGALGAVSIDAAALAHTTTTARTTVALTPQLGPSARGLALAGTF